MLRRELVCCDFVRSWSCTRQLGWRRLQCGTGADDEQRLQLRSTMRRDNPLEWERNGGMCVRCIIGAGDDGAAKLCGPCSLLDSGVSVEYSCC